MQTERAYSSSYVEEATEARGGLFALIANKEYGWDFSHFYEGFMRSETARLLDKGWPRLVCLNEYELLQYLQEKEPRLFIKGEHPWWVSAAEWAGWFLCQYQWYWNTSSKELVERYTPDCLLRIWPGAHSWGLMNYVMDNPPPGKVSDLH